MLMAGKGGEAFAPAVGPAEESPAPGSLRASQERQHAAGLGSFALRLQAPGSSSPGH